MNFKQLEEVKHQPKIPKWFKYNPYIKYLEIILKDDEYFGYIFINNYGGVESITIRLEGVISEEEQLLLRTQIEKIYSTQSEYPYLIMQADEKFDTSDYDYIDRILTLRNDNKLPTELVELDDIEISKDVPEELQEFLKTCYNYDNFYDYNNFEEQAQEYKEEQKAEFVSSFKNEERIGLLILQEKELQTEIEHLCVLPTERRKGVAEKLLRAVFNKSKSKPITLDVYENNSKALNLYKKSGFVEEEQKGTYLIMNGKNMVSA
jgi:ribosomal protein S18 acetylase RimI-like enzyme